MLLSIRLSQAKLRYATAMPDVRAAPTRATASFAGIVTETVCARIWSESPQSKKIRKEKVMTQHEFEYWQAVTQSSKYQWVEDRITRLNGNGALYYTGGEDGLYMRLSPDGKLTVGTYEDAFPHIGEAMFRREAEHQQPDFSSAFEAACKLGGKQFLADMFSQEEVSQSLVEPDEPEQNSFEMKM